MVQNPKYDNDLVTLGYLKSKLNEQNSKIKKEINIIPKSYANPPNPPYYKGSLLMYNGNLYRCKEERLIGVFSFNDWEIIQINDAELKDFIYNVYSMDKLEIEEQIDGKIETHFQSNDPALEWTDDLLKQQHVGDYWNNTTDNTQWRFNQHDTNPITYSWGSANVPMSIFDMVNGKKNLYISKPNSYNIGDLWLIENDISQSDIPDDVSIGTWAIATQNSDSYNKAHWLKRSNNVIVEYIEHHYYNKEQISEEHYSKSEVDSRITQSNTDILLEVEQNYTKTDVLESTLNDFDEAIGTLAETTTTQGVSISNLIIETGDIRSTVASNTTVINDVIIDVEANKEEILNQLENYAPNSKVLEIENSVTQIQTDTYTKTQIDTKLIDGSVTKVQTTTGTFDENGVFYEKSNAKTNIRVGFENDNEGLMLKGKTGNMEENILFAGYDNQIGKTVVTSNYIEVQKIKIGTHSRIEDYEDGTGIFNL